MVFKYSYLSTSVSKLEQNKIRKLYNHKSILYSNAITINNHNYNQKQKREMQQDYIIYCGSYKYKPNKNAIDYLNNKIMPSLIKKIPNLYCKKNQMQSAHYYTPFKSKCLTGKAHYSPFAFSVNKKSIAKTLSFTGKLNQWAFTKSYGIKEVFQRKFIKILLNNLQNMLALSKQFIANFSII